MNTLREKFEEWNWPLSYVRFDEETNSYRYWSCIEGTNELGFLEVHEEFNNKWIQFQEMYTNDGTVIDTGGAV